MKQKIFLIFLVIATSLILILPAHAVSVEYKVAKGSDDAYEMNGGMVVEGSIVAVGKDWGSAYRGGYRFANVNIPKGAKITNASLILSYNWRSGPNANTDLYGEYADNAAGFGNNIYNISNRPKTAAKVDWNNMPSGAIGEFFASPNISSIIQEIIDRAGWSPGNSLTILHYEDVLATNEWESVSYEGYGYPSYAASLKVDYVVNQINQTIQKVIIFRDDDAQAWWSVDLTLKNITDMLINHKIPQTIGVIPTTTQGYRIGSDTNFKNYLNKIKNYSMVELAMHGYQHTPNEFKKVTQAVAELKLSAGLAIFNSDLKLKPITFIPPSYSFNNATLTASKNKGFTRISSHTDVDPYSWKEYPAGILHVPGTVSFYDWDANRQRTYNEITSDCQNSLNMYDVCVFVIHHWQFSDNSVTINPATYKILLDVINWTHGKEEEGVKLMTIGQYSRK